MHWSYKADHRHVFDYVKDLIEFRKSQRVFQLIEPEEIKKAVKMFHDIEGVIRYEISSPYKTDEPTIQIIHNGCKSTQMIPVKDLKVRIDGALYYHEKCDILDDVLHLPKYSSVVLIKSK